MCVYRPPSTQISLEIQRGRPPMHSLENSHDRSNSSTGQFRSDQLLLRRRGWRGLLGGFDRPVSARKKSRSEAPLHPSLCGAGRRWNNSERERYHAILSQADSVDYASQDYYDGCMINRNHRLVESAGLLLAVYNGARRCGTGATVNYARKLGRKLS